MVDKSDFCDRIGNYLSELRKWSSWQNIILGQILSVLLCCMNGLAKFLDIDENVLLPMAQSFPHYFLLCVMFSTWLAFRRGDRGLVAVLKARGLRYCLLCIIDVHAKTLLISAHHYTTLQSIQLLSCVGIPVALALSCLVLGVRYKLVHILGISICLAGVGCLVRANIDESKIDGKNHLVGDMLCLGGAVLFAIVTVLQELSICHTDIVEYLGVLGIFGSIISGLQLLTFEKKTLIILWKDSNILLTSFSVSQFLFCVLSSIFLIGCGTTALHLSLITGNFYTLIVGILIFNYKFEALYFLSFTLAMIGIYVYAIQKTAGHRPQTQSAQNNQCENQEHTIITPPSPVTPILSGIPGLDITANTDTFPLSVSNNTFTSFYGSHPDIVNERTTST